MNNVVGWSFYIALVLSGLAAVCWTTSVAHRYGQERMHLGDTALSFWTLAAFVGLFVGLWLPVLIFLGARSLVRRANRAR
jgi:hypothetical protein